MQTKESSNSAVCGSWLQGLRRPDPGPELHQRRHLTSGHQGQRVRERPAPQRDRREDGPEVLQQAQERVALPQGGHATAAAAPGGHAGLEDHGGAPER